MVEVESNRLGLVSIRLKRKLAEEVVLEGEVGSGGVVASCEALNLYLDLTCRNGEAGGSKRQCSEDGVEMHGWQVSEMSCEGQGKQQCV